MSVTIKQLENAVGTLSNTSKMPGFSFGISAKRCKRGAKLAKVEGSVCHKCYASRGMYQFPNVQAAQEYRLEAFNNMGRQEWVETMAALISRKLKGKEPFFRIFDSGDLQNTDMLVRWALVALLLPGIHFWMSTRERAIVNRVFTHHFPKPSNLVVRVSADMIDGPVPKGFTNTSATINRGEYNRNQWRSQAYLNTPSKHFCPAPLQEGKCGDCRACWDHKVKTVVYLEH